MLKHALSYLFTDKNNFASHIKYSESGFFLTKLDHYSPNVYQSLKLKDVCSNVYSGSYSTKQVKEDSLKSLQELQYPVYGATGILRYTAEYKFDEPKLLIGRVGNPGYVHQAQGKYNVSDNALIIDINESKCDFHYLYYYLQTCDLSRYANGGAQKCLTATSVKNVKIKLPSLKQQYIVGKFFNTLDRYINSLQNELTLREKQFEYYLNQLFK